MAVVEKNSLRSGQFVVTGGGGFIGLHLVEHLQRQGADRITVVDNLKCSSEYSRSRLSEYPNVELVVHDLGADDPKELERHLRNTDCLFHLAAEKHNQSLDVPERLLRVNIEGTYRLLDCATRSDVQ